VIAGKGFVVRSENPWATELLGVLCKALAETRSSSVVGVQTATAVGAQDVLVHSATEGGLWVSPYDRESDTVSRSAWEIPFDQIRELTLY
jgi:hypothetical protein